MMDIFLLYLWTRLDGLNLLMGFMVMFFIIAAGVSAFNWWVNHDMIEFNDKYIAKAAGSKKAAIKFVTFAIIPVLILLLVPTQKDAAIIAGGWAVKQVATSEGAQQLSSKTFALINGKLDEELAKLKKETK